MDDLRTEIFDLIYRKRDSMMIDDIAQLLQRSIEQIRDAVDHPWFVVADQSVDISRSGSSKGINNDSSAR